MLNYKQNGDIHLGPIRVWNQYRQSPPRLLMLAYAVGGLGAAWLAIHGLHIALGVTYA